MSGGRKTVTFGSVQQQYINTLRAELLGQAGSDNFDLNFTEGANLAAVIALAFHHADEYRDRVAADGGPDLSYDVAAAEIVGEYLVTGDVPAFVKDSFREYAEYFATTVVQTTLTDEPGVPTREWWDEHGQDHDDVLRQFTAEPPEE